MLGLREESYQNWDLFVIRFAKNLCGNEVVGNRYYLVIKLTNCQEHVLVLLQR